MPPRSRGQMKMRAPLGFTVRLTVFAGIWMSALLAAGTTGTAESRPEVRVGPLGLESLTFDGYEVLRSGAVSLDTVELRRLNGSRVEVSKSPQATRVDTSGRATIFSYDWGMLTVRYEPQPGRLQVVIELENRSDYSIRGFRLRLLELPSNPPAGGVSLVPKAKANLEGPDTVTLGYPQGHLILANEEIGRFLQINAATQGAGGADSALAVVLATAIKGRHLGPSGEVVRAIDPGQTDRFRLSVKFLPKGTNPEAALRAIYSRFAQSFPATVRWPDRRPIGTLFLSGSGRGSAANPRGWFNNPEKDFTSSEGRLAFRRELLGYADRSVAILKGMGAQGMIVWDVEGQEYKHPISYLGDPRSLPPEMDAVADEFFHRFTDSGLRCGVTVRPQIAVRPVYGNAAYQASIADPAGKLDEKVRYARQRWGCTLFYIDSNGDPNWPMEASFVRQVAVQNPEVLLIPEQNTDLYWAYTAPYCDLRLRCTSTPSEVKAMYPDAFSVIWVGDGDIKGNWPSLTRAVRSGDVLLFPGWFDHPANLEVKSLYEEAQRASSAGPDRIKASVAR